MGYVALRGTALECDPEEATKEFWSGWINVYPEGPSTSFYALLRIVPDHIEFASYDRFHVDEGSNRTDWRALTLLRNETGNWTLLT
mmetsp:Transcript_14533/g.27427  ORF Transcript_14533/g.27427 Transcript_14533/m.27427 type:complete len:86 (-) Transcript_14533:398-655(-)